MPGNSRKMHTKQAIAGTHAREQLETTTDTTGTHAREQLVGVEHVDEIHHDNRVEHDCRLTLINKMPPCRGLMPLIGHPTITVGIGRKFASQCPHLSSTILLHFLVIYYTYTLHYT